MSDDVTAAHPVTCGMPLAHFDRIRLGHGSGGKLSAELLESVFLPALGNPVLALLNDAADVVVGSASIAVTTDSYVVNPIFFPGGDIGSLAVHGTINDLSMRGAKPLFVTASFILEEGFLVADLRRIVQSMRAACDAASVQCIAGDTKVVNRGAADRIFINTTGIGVMPVGNPPAANRALPGDAVIVSGDLGLHGMAIMCSREGLELETTIESDSAPLHAVVQEMISSASEIHCLRDLTRGGLASAVNELAASSSVGIELEEKSIPVHPQVQAACELLGLDPLYVACEGRLIAIVPAAEADALAASMRRHPGCSRAAVIGRVVSEHAGRVVLTSRVGGRRILDKLSGEQLPRIC